MIETELDNLIINKNRSILRRKIIYESIISLTTAYTEIDKIFIDEMKYAESRKAWGCFIYFIPLSHYFLSSRLNSKDTLLGKIVTSMSDSFNISSIEKYEDREKGFLYKDNLDIVV
jgi:hypothetical protein